MIGKEKTIKELKEALDSLDITNKYRLNIIRAIEYLQEEPVSEDLEEACDSYYDETWDEHGGRAMVVDGCHDIWFPSFATDDFFKAGAKWQEEKDQDAVEIAKKEVIEETAEWLTKNAKKYYFNKNRYLGTDELVEDYKLIMSM